MASPVSLAFCPSFPGAKSNWLFIYNSHFDEHWHMVTVCDGLSAFANCDQLPVLL